MLPNGARIWAFVCMLCIIGSFHTLTAAKEEASSIGACSSSDLYHCSPPPPSSDSSKDADAALRHPECIPRNWVCDGDRDCFNGDDEEQNCTLGRCDSYQFECPPSSKVRCIPLGWHCDGEKDCDLGEDEWPTLCRTKLKKGDRSRGKLVDTFKCLPNRFRCPQTRTCIPVVKVCDGVVDCPMDGADEGPHCINRACRSKSCPGGECRETFQGAMCFCPEGQEFNNTSCIDLNECNYESFCDQMCENGEKNYTCSCKPGYQLVGKGECRIPDNTTARLAVASFFNVQLLELNHGQDELTPTKFEISGAQITTLDVDVRNNSICWLELTPESKTSQFVCASVDKPEKKWEIKTQYSLDSVKAVAKDWLSGNWYFADENKEVIFVCTADGIYCRSILTFGIKRPKSLAVDSTRGYLFYSDWSSAHIGRMDLDGGNVQPLTKIKLVHPHGLTLDIANSLLYWGDSFLDVIERFDYNGGNRMVIAKGVNVAHVFGMTILENFLYVANHINNSIVRVHRYDTSVPNKVMMRATSKLWTIKIFHPVAQPYDNMDVCKAAKCEHMCMPVPREVDVDGVRIRARCVCHLGYEMDSNNKCQKRTTDQFVLLTNGQQGMIHCISTKQNEASTDLYPPIANLERPMAVDFDAVEGYIYFADMAKHIIGRRKFNSGTGYEVFAKQGVNCDGLAVDWVGRNLYCADQGRNRIVAISLQNSSHIFSVLDQDIFKDSISPKALAINPSKGILYWSNWFVYERTGNASINWVALDGSGWGQIAYEKIQWPNSLVLDPSSDTLYWTDGFYDRIESMKTDGSNRQVLISFKTNELPFGLTKVGNTLLWADSLDGTLRQLDLNTKTSSIFRNNSHPLFDVTLYNSTAQKPIEKHPCSINNGGCTDLCLLTPAGSHVCKCADGRTSNNNGATCSGEAASTLCQERHHFQCKNGECIDIARTCDGHFDCSDWSDEDKNTGGICSNRTCENDGMYQCSNMTDCIYAHFVCDGEVDCWFGDDERNCEGHTCGPDNMACRTSGQCIPDIWRCDGERDCPDGSDEGDECCPSGKCNELCGADEFTCLDGRCIKYQYRCDNEYDCADNSDELDCGNWCDPLREFKCANESFCLSRLFLCDGELNCLDGSDEKDCDKRERICHPDEFSCLDGTCLKKMFLCDDREDCIDGSDEMNCSKNISAADKTCHWTQFRCDDGTQCIPTSWQCDDEFDCRDKSDEKHCAKQCLPPNFACKDHPTMCLKPEKLCNNINDCPDHSDEGRLCEYDMCMNHDCQGTCHKSPTGFVCSCPENQRLRPDNKTCMDIDTCEKWGVCSQRCQPTAHGHRCFCSKGYTLSPDGYSCKPDDPDPVYIIYSNRHEIRRLNVRNGTVTQLVSGLRNTIALDFHFEKSLIFWTDVIDDKIYRGEIKANTVTKIEPIIEFGLATTEGVAVDWISDNIYWVESNLDQIEVAKLDGSNRTTLIAGNMSSPRAIVLDPRVGKLFWTDWDGAYPRIESCSMAGELHTRDIVYDIRNHKGAGWPNGLAVDYELQRLYWVDARSDSIHSITYEGQDHRMILKSHRTLNHPFSLTVFEHVVYWTDWRFNTLVMANKFNGSDVNVIQRTYSQPFDLQIFHPKRQPRMKNPCASANCTHLCLIGDELKAVCRCPHRFKLSEDSITCVGDNTFLLFAKENEIRGVDLDNAHYNVIPSITVPFVENATSIDYDVKEERLYWTDMKKNVITSAYLNGTGITTVIDSGLSNPSAFAIDWMSRNMYFSSYNEEKASISVAKLDGAYRKEIYTKSESKPNSIAIEPTLGLMFWSDLGGEQHSIWRAKMDGKQNSLFVTGKGVKKPASLTLDLETNRLYWISREEEAVYWCSINSSQCQPTRDQSVPIQAPISMTIYKPSNKLKDKIFLFYANNTNIIKYQNGKKMVMREDTPNVYDLRVYDPSSREGQKNKCSDKNGGCDQLCLPSGVDGIVCECTVGYTIKNNKCVGIDFFLLYSQASEIHGMTLDAKDGVLAPISKISLATSVDFHAANSHIYWVDSERRLISRIKRDLSGRETIVADGISGAESLAVDWIGGNVYWTDLGHNTVEVTKLDGTKRYVVLHDSIEKPRSIVLHPAQGYMYFANGGDYPRIIRARLDGSERVDFVKPQDAPIKAPYGLAVDYDTGDLYWCDKDLNLIERVTPNGSRHVVLNHNLTDCMSLAIDEDRIYWADVTDLGGSIKYVSKSTGTGLGVLKKEIARLKDIRVFKAGDQIGSNPCTLKNGGCEELCLYRGGDMVTCACSNGQLAHDGKSCEDYDAFLLYSEVTSLKSLLLGNTTNQNVPRKPIMNENLMKNVIGLASDHARERIFFSDIQQGNIQSVFFNGTGFKVVLSAVESAEGLAYDPLHDHLYWTRYSGSNINRITLTSQSTTDSGPTTEVFVQLDSHDHPRDIVVNSCIRRVFWTNWSDRRPSIQTAAFDSQGRANFTESIITDKIRTPNGLTIDHKAQKLYWSDARLDKIERCDFDGSNRIVIVTTIPQHSFGLAVYGDFLYWTDWMLRAVIRASKYDGSGITWLRKNISRPPMGVIAVSRDTDDCTVSPCYNNAYGCSETCIVDERGNPYCLCVEGKKLLPDGKRCVLESVRDCGKDDFVCEDSKLCVTFDKTCNGIPDCLDASDEMEEYCRTRSCPIGLYSCQGSRRCIPEHNICDGRNDCGDGSDELNCPCAENQFRCNDGMCILAKYKCDYDSDCPDHSDEMGCNKTCDDLEISGVKHHNLVPCNTTSMCIYPHWICDGTNDCWDNSDEENCGDTVPGGCAENAFMCANGNCILPQWRCDKEADCADGSDEMNCTYTCEADQHTCNNSMCVPHSWVCDGHPDCSDGSDEAEHCAQQNCTEEHFRCPSGRCIPKEWLCDGDTDCPHGEDERVDDKANCSAVECASDQFTCLNRRCVRAEFYCDGENDCGDDSDEPDVCVYGQCEDNEFQCKEDLKCIKASKRCNGKFDCHDHSDEKDCPTLSEEQLDVCHNTSHFQCTNKVCIDDALVCNGRDDCGDGSDEPSSCRIDECKSKRPPVCSQICVDKKIGYECECYAGYQLEPDGMGGKKGSVNRKCVDVNECSTTFPCSHYCTNTVGSFKCSCAAGYKMIGDGRTCVVADGIEPKLLVSNRYYLRLIGTVKNGITTITNELKNSVAVDYDWEEQMIYWSDITSDRSTISRMAFNFSTGEKIAEPVLLHGNTVRNPDGLAVDWVGRNLYWCDKTTDTIEVSRLDGKYRKVLIRSGLQEPRALEVFPQKGLLFFSDWGDVPHISRMNMDGTDLRRIINESISWPNALTLDYITEKIYWGDGNLDYIGMADLDGQNIRVIIGDNRKIPHVFALTTFEGLLYWTDWESSGVFSSPKFSGNNVTKVIGLVHRPMDIHVVHPLRQQPLVDKRGFSPCDHLMCNHLCLLRPGRDGREVEAICACPENHYLAEDGRSCISNCTSSQFLCESSSKCIPFWWKCDGHKDCDDGSDEPAEQCGKYYCSQHGMFQCANATSSNDCYMPTQICDGTQQCADNSDESICATYTCLEHFVKCSKDNKCILKSKVCDGLNDCSDGQDEQNCTAAGCNENQFQCDNKRCVPYVWMCDNDDDCGDNSDEPPNCHEVKCRAEFFKCNSTGRCIPQAWKCDGDQDCGDHDASDEDSAECHEQTCDPTFFRCLNGHCIPGRWRCDYYDDCRDGTDEKDCIARECSESEFRCSNHKCIPQTLKCNGVIDCVDRSDEKDCDYQCSDNQFKCQNMSHCIPNKWVCDGDTDCADGTDEWKCNRNCTENEFKCDNSICKPKQWRCDGDDDCGDGSDEKKEVCANLACPPGRFKCRDHKCIWNIMVCNGVKDCDEGEDEDFHMCSLVQTCTFPNFVCESRTQCLRPTQVCNGIKECLDGSDEDTKYCNTLNVSKSVSCSVNNGGCDHHCENTHYGPQCSCHKFYALNSDGMTCSFDNPCDHYETCSQKCEFDPQKMSLICSCNKGYYPESKIGNPACVALGGEPHMLIAEKGNVIMRAKLHSNDTENSTLITPESGNKANVISSIDMDIAENVMFFINQTGPDHFLMKKSDVTWNKTGKRRRREISTKSPEILHLQDRQIFAMGGLAVDWVSHYIYLTDTTNRAIYVYNYNGQRGKVVVKGDLTEPHTVAVDPIAGYIFWADRGPRPKIERANLDGSDRRTIVDTEISWPNGLALDTQRGWIYWADTKKHAVEVARYDGSGRQMIPSPVFQNDPPYALEVFEDYLYVLTYVQSQVVKIHKFQQHPYANQPAIMFYALPHARDIAVVQENKQQKVKSNCSETACQATQICFNKPQDKQGFVCLCPDGARLVGGKCDYVAPPICDGYCQNGGSCEISKVTGKPKCSCPSQYHGSRCERTLCTDYCLNNGVCTLPSSPGGQPTCSCSGGFSGDRCERYVCTNYCQNGGICHLDLNGAPVCMCPALYSGDRCEKLTGSCGACRNGGSCVREQSGYLSCRCSEGFTGPHCDQCVDKICHNGGTCYKVDKESKCSCPYDLDPDQECRTRLKCDLLCNQPVKPVPFPAACDCKCAPTYLAKNCDSCEGYCQHGTCRMFQGVPLCYCHDTMYKGKRCDECICEPTGRCVVDANGKTVCSCSPETFGPACEYSCVGVCGKNAYCQKCFLNTTSHRAECVKDGCVCYQGYSGPECQSNNTTAEQEGSAATDPVAIAVPIAAILVVIIIAAVVIVFVLRRRKRRLSQYGHKRMDDRGGNMNVTNPVYMKRDGEEDEDDEYDPLSGGAIFTGDPSTNFANPVYEVYSDSTQKLLAGNPQEENHNFDDLQVEYLGSENGKANSEQSHTTHA